MIQKKEFNNIERIVENTIFSKSGDFSIIYILTNPPLYTLSADELNLRNEEFFKAFKRMPNNSYIHQQDIFVKKSFDSSIIPGDSFIQKAERTYFDNRKYLEHFTLLAFSLKGVLLKDKSQKDNEINEFMDLVENSCFHILKNMKGTSIREIKENEYKSILFDLVNGFSGPISKDLFFDESIRFDTDIKGIAYCINESKQLPDEAELCEEKINFGMLYAGMFDTLGLTILGSHVVNQIWSFHSNYMTDLMANEKSHVQHKDFDKDIARSAEVLDQTIKRIKDENNILIKFHFNIIFWGSDTELYKINNTVKDVFGKLDITPYQPKFENLFDLFLGSIIGQESTLKQHFYFSMDLRSSLLFRLNGSTNISSENGIFFNDRYFNCPFKIDLWEQPISRKIPARNGIIFADTGSGKSVGCGNMIQQYLELGYKIVVVEFGRSFKTLTDLYPDISLHIDYNANEPLGINPFDIKGDLTPTHRTDLINLISKLWKKPFYTEEEKESLDRMLMHYYSDVKDDHSITGFFSYVSDNFSRFCTEKIIEERYFDMESFKYIFTQFVKGGKYENICKESSLKGKIADKQLVVLELTEIKKDPFLIDIIISFFLPNIMNDKLLNKNERSYIFMDEYAELQSVKTKESEYNHDIHTSVGFLFQKLRKDTCAIYIILQNPFQLKNDNVSASIIANTQIVIVFPATELIYQEIEKRFKIEKQYSIVNQMRSISNNYTTRPYYSEMFFMIRCLEGIILRLELSPAKFLALQTDGTVWQSIQDEARNTGKSIQEIIEQKAKDL